MTTKREGVPTYDKAELDEPIFVLRAHDITAPIIVELYALHCTTIGVDQDKVDGARKIAARMRAWQTIHGCKRPD